MRRLLGFGVLILLVLMFAGCGGGGALHPPVRGVLVGGAVVQTGQASVVKSPGAPVLVSVTWSTAFTDTNYTAVCTPNLVSGGTSDLSVVILSKSSTGAQVLVQFNDSGNVQVNCLAVADSATGDLRHARAGFNSPGTNKPSIQTLAWNSAFTDTSYSAVCSTIASTETVPLTSHLDATTTANVTTWVNYVTTTAKPFEVDCLGVPSSTTSGVRQGLANIVETIMAPVSVSMNWDTPFPDTNYFPVCDTQFISGTEISITTNASGSTVTSQTATVHWATNDGVGTTKCIAVHP